LMMALLGGLGTLWGPFLGAGVFIFAQDYISTMTEHWMIFLGLRITSSATSFRGWQCRGGALLALSDPASRPLRQVVGPAVKGVGRQSGQMTT